MNENFENKESIAIKNEKAELNFIRRVAASIIDHFIVFSLMTLIILPFKKFIFINLFGGMFLLYFVVTTLLLIQTFFCIFEFTLKGQTPGKKITGLKAVDESGAALNFKQIFIRNFSRGTYLFPLFFVLPDLLTYLFSKDHKRIGDFLAGSIVVKTNYDRTNNI